MGGGKDESTCVVPTPAAYETSFMLSAPLIVEIAIGTVQRTPQSAESRMEETQPSHASIGSVALEDSDPAEKLAIRLSMVEDDEADVISTPDQLVAQQDLLTFGSADMGQICSS
jgi:hypothetical protein